MRLRPLSHLLWLWKRRSFEYFVSKRDSVKNGSIFEKYKKSCIKALTFKNFHFFHWTFQRRHRFKVIFHGVCFTNGGHLIWFCRCFCKTFDFIFMNFSGFNKLILLLFGLYYFFANKHGSWFFLSKTFFSRSVWKFLKIIWLLILHFESSLKKC